MRLRRNLIKWLWLQEVFTYKARNSMRLLKSRTSTNGSNVQRAKKMLSYLKACFKIYWLLLTKYRGYEVFFVSIPPMGYLLNLILPHRFSMVIWDVYPDIFKITGMKETHPLYRTWAWLNRKSFKNAFRLFTISEKIGRFG